MRILAWHVHGGWMDAFVRGDHDYVIPTEPAAMTGLCGSGRPWPERAREVDPERVSEEDIDLVVLQRPEEIALAERMLGRTLGRDVPALFVEHNTPKGAVPTSEHPLKDRTDIPVVHVTHFNRLMWDTGDAPTLVIEHGIADPGLRYTGERPHLAVVVNEPVRRWRVTGTDLLPRFAEATPVEAYGISTDLLPAALDGLPDGRLLLGGNLKTDPLHAALAGCRVYVHPLRWTSLGLSLLEAMHLGMPVVVLATTEATRAVPPEAGAISADVDDLVRAAQRLIDDPGEARARGLVAREAALGRYSLARFLAAWDDAIDDAVSSARRPGSRVLAEERTPR
jgi:hypothetical protein